MTTAQIIIYSIIALIFISSILHITSIYNKHNEAPVVIIALFFIFTILITISIVLTTDGNRNKGKCPEYEQIQQTIYIPKINK